MSSLVREFSDLAAASSYELKNKSERVWSVEALDRLE